MRAPKHMRDKKGQGLPLVKLVAIIIAVMVLIVFVTLGTGFFSQGSKAIRDFFMGGGKACIDKDYIIGPYLSFDESEAITLHFVENVPNEELGRQPYYLYEGWAQTNDDIMSYEPDPFRVLTKCQSCFDGSERSSSLGTLGQVGGICMIDGVRVPGLTDNECTREGGDWVNSPNFLHDDAAIHAVRIIVLCEGQDPTAPAQDVILTFDEMSFLLQEFLKYPMNALQHFIYNNEDGKHGNTALEWAKAMHHDRTDAGSGFFWTGAGCQAPKDQSLCHPDPEEDEGTWDKIRATGAETHTGTFEDYIEDLGCSLPELTGDDASKHKSYILQHIVTGLFGDLQDFKPDTNLGDTAGQDWARLRDGDQCCSHAKRGYVDKDGNNDQLVPVFLRISYPPSNCDGGSSCPNNGDAYIIAAATRGHEDIEDRTPGWIAERPNAVEKFRSRIDGCFEGRDIFVEMFVLPQDQWGVTNEGHRGCNSLMGQVVEDCATADCCTGECFTDFEGISYCNCVPPGKQIGPAGSYGEACSAVNPMPRCCAGGGCSEQTDPRYSSWKPVC